MASGVEAPPSPDVEMVIAQTDRGIGFAERMPESFDDPDINVLSDYCGELSWPRAARVVWEIEYSDACPEAMEEWVRAVVSERWERSRARMKLPPADHQVLQGVVSRISKGLPRMILRCEYRPLTTFVMMHPRDVDRRSLRSVMLRRKDPVGWIEAAREGGGGLSFRYDDSSVPVDPESLPFSSYGEAWAAKDAPSPRPVFATPEQLKKIHPDKRHWYVYSPGVEGWVPATRTKDGRWIQTLQGTGIRHPIDDVPGTDYGKDVGALAPLYDGGLERAVDVLVRHPQYDARWLGAYGGGDGKLYARSYPSDVEVRADLSPDNFGRTWCWPPSLPPPSNNSI